MLWRCCQFEGGYPLQMKHAGIPVLTEQFETDEEMEQLARVVKLWPGQGTL